MGADVSDDIWNILDVLRADAMSNQDGTDIFRRTFYDLASVTQAVAGLAALRLAYTVKAGSSQPPGQRETLWWKIVIEVTPE